MKIDIKEIEEENVFDEEHLDKIKNDFYNQLIWWINTKILTPILYILLVIFFVLLTILLCK